MSRKTTKSILSRDEISLLINSEEPKNTQLYGNLYEVLKNLKDIKAITSNELSSLQLNEIGIAALTYNKQTLIENVKQEWYVESQSAEDPDKKIHCGLCNTPNKYLFYIRNRFNNIQLNVGSYCMTKFPGIDGYVEHKEQLNKIQNNQRIIERRTKFLSKFPNAMSIIDSANYYFDNLPILLPYDIYSVLKDTVFQLRIIYTKYINYGKTPFKSLKNSFELFEYYIDKFNSLKKRSDYFVQYNINKQNICKRTEIDWMIQNKQDKLLEDISNNNGIYTEETLQKLTSVEFIKNNFDIFIEHNKSKIVQLIRFKDIYSPMLFTIEKNGYSFLYEINIKKFMSQIGAKCFFNKDYIYDENGLFTVSFFVNSRSNMECVIDSIKSILNRSGYAILIDEITNDIYIYKKSDKSIKSFQNKRFLNIYSTYIIKKSIDIYKFIGIITHKNWITYEEQEKQGIEDKIKNMYYHQYIEPYQ